MSTPGSSRRRRGVVSVARRNRLRPQHQRFLEEARPELGGPGKTFAFQALGERVLKGFHLPPAKLVGAKQANLFLSYVLEAMNCLTRKQAVPRNIARGLFDAEVWLSEHGVLKRRLRKKSAPLTQAQVMMLNIQLHLSLAATLGVRKYRIYKAARLDFIDALFGR
ncbi:MAG TPA: hypothetical protein HA252_02900 [Candidatus Diapherotrites archaeon]|uniref:Uncharacterized protein n=1 Tax=Candidatus Iainarchaeum sp. TaxID=3101447 RepID=A0A7J4JK68_9ARCH|nr:hypothetical protein [Candidatus Diapherotrites archaeon]HIH16327.1 hypothetical protein [Candidatus Diapherotrites archaeon]